MTGAEHYEKAQQLAQVAARHLTEERGDMRIAEITAGISQAHAALALAAAVEKAGDATHGYGSRGYGR